MSNIIFIIIVVYAGLCVGTYISLRQHNIILSHAIFFALFFPLPIFFILISVAISIAKDNHKKHYIFRSLAFLAISLCSYAEAIEILGEMLTRNKTYSIKYEIHEIHSFSSRVRQRVYNNVIVT